MTALCFLALAAVTPQDAMATPITLQYAAAPTRGCVQQLAETAHVKFMVDEELAWEPIIVRVKDRPLRKVMDAMADALGGVWVEQEGGWKLNPDRDLAKQEQAEADAEMRAVIEESLADTIETIKDVDWSGAEGKDILDKEMAKLNQIVEKIKADNPNFGAGGSMTIMSGGTGDNSPAHNLLKKVLQTVSVEQLNSIPWDSTVVYSDLPTARQKRLPRSIGSSVTDFVKAHNAMANAAEKVKAGLPQGINLRSASLDAKPIQGGIKKVILSVRRDETGQGFNVSMKVADGAGKIVGGASTSLFRNSDGTEAQPQAPNLSDLGLGEKAGDLVELPAASRELAAALSQSVGPNGFQKVGVISMGNGGAPARIKLAGDNGEEAPLSKEARNLAARPDKIDPLSLAPGELTAALADQLKLDLIAVLPDKAATEAGKVLLQGKVAYGRIPSFLDQSNAVAAVKDGVLVVEPKRHADSRWNRVNRGALSRLTGELADKGFVRMMEVAHYASNGHTRGNLDRAYLKLFTEDWDDALFGMSSTRRLFRILGHTTSETEVRAGKLAATEMNKSLRTELESLLYSTEALFMIGGKGNFVSIAMTDGGGAPPEQSEPSLADEPTEKYPNGLPADSVLAVQVNAGRSLFMHNQKSGRGTFCTPQELAMKMHTFTQDVTPPNYRGDDYSYAVAEMKDILVQVDIPALGPQMEYFKDGKLDTSAPRVTYGRLPDDFAKEIKEMLEQFDQNPIRFGGPGAGKTPPPSP